MTSSELLYRCLRPFDHPLYGHVYRALTRLEGDAADRPRVLDVGGRRSNYTIGLNGRILISDIPRESELQHQLDLGTNDGMRKRVLARRSNVDDYVIDDMTRSAFPDASFDIVVAVEVLEHVEEDAAFVRNVARVLKPGGAFLMTTPNGDFLRKLYPDHKRHYERQQLRALLATYFDHVDVKYAVNDDTLIRLGVHHPSLRTPIRSLISPAALFLSNRLEAVGVGGQGPERKRHLFAIARAPKPAPRPS
jgi:SAM-dependent methyltransferase